MNRFYLFFFVFWMIEWMRLLRHFCVCVYRVELDEQFFVCLFVFFFSIRWKRQTGRLRWLTKHYLISLNFWFDWWIAQCGTTRIWVSQTKSTRMWNHFDCRRDRFFLPLCWFNTKWQRENVSKKKKIKSNKFPMEEDEGDKRKEKSLVRALWSVTASLRLKTELARLVIFPLLYITHVLPYSVPPFPDFFLQQQQLYRIGKELFFLDRHVCVYIRL